MKTSPVDKKIVCYQAILIFERLKEEAGEMAKDENFIDSNGWFSRFKTRSNRHSIVESGEVASANIQAASSFPDRLKGMIEEGGYSSHTIINVDETGLFWKMLK